MKWNILLIWPSWSGKTTFSQEIISHSKIYKLFMADTSREIREWETNWIDYNFISAENILSNARWKEKYLIEEYYKNYYWYNLMDFNEKSSFILTPWIKVVEDILKRKQEFWFALSILLSIDIKTFKERLQKRGESESEIIKRKKSLELLDFTSKVDLVLDGNTTLEKNRIQLLQILSQ